MKLNHLIFSFLFVFAGGTVCGQSYSFKVLANKGANKVKTGADWQPLKTGASLESGDELVISENAYLGLVHASGKTLEVKTAGNYKVSDLAGKIKTEGSSVASKYADFVLSKMSAEGKKNRLSATGAVHRGSNEAIRVYLPGSVAVYNEEVIIRWDAIEGAGGYEVSLKNMFDDVLLTLETTDPKLILDLNKSELAKEKVLLLTVRTKGDESIKSGTYAVKRLHKADAEVVERTLNDLMLVVDKETALNNYILAGFYEEKNLLVDALTKFEQAVKMAPEVENYKDAYLEFLLRNRLNE